MQPMANCHLEYGISAETGEPDPEAGLTLVVLEWCGIGEERDGV